MTGKPREFFVNLYRDFRDRHLLLPVGLLVAALIAVPVLLSASPTSPPAPPEDQEIEATAATPAVLAEQVGIRNYRKRLRQLKRKNPFEQQYTGPTATSGKILELDAGDAGGGAGDFAGISADTGDESGSAEPVATDGADGSDDSNQGATGSDEPGKATQPVEPPSEDRWFTWEVDLVFGPVKETERFEGARAMEFLPARRGAVAVVAGIGLRGNRAGFMFLTDVTGSEGDGKCAPGAGNCVFLVLKPGEQRRVTVVGQDGREVTYRIKVLEIVRAELKPGEIAARDGGG